MQLWSSSTLRAGPISTEKTSKNLQIALALPSRFQLSRQVSRRKLYGCPAKTLSLAGPYLAGDKKGTSLKEMWNQLSSFAADIRERAEHVARDAGLEDQVVSL